MMTRAGFDDCHDHRRILVVDDDRDIREMISQVLTIEGYRVTSAANGQEALEQLRDERTRAGLILLDLMMPVMNGWEMRAEMARDPLLAAIPVVVISGDGEVPKKEAAMGAAGYITKPIELDALLATVGRFFHPAGG